MGRPAGSVTRPVKLRERTVDLRQGDFITLRKIAAGDMEIRHFEKDYNRLRKLGLVTHKFQDRSGWPIALAVLTADGMEALPLEHAAA